MRNFCIFVQLLQNKPYLVLLVTFGSGIGLFTCLTTILEQVICPRGYSDVSIVMKILQYVSWIIKITSIKNIPDILLIFPCLRRIIYKLLDHVYLKQTNRKWILLLHHPYKRQKHFSVVWSDFLIHLFF